MTRSSSDTRHAILQAAEHIAHALGFSHLTLEAVAQAAGVSKGGLLYHFPSKEALVKGMVLDHVDLVMRRIDQVVADTSDSGPGGWARAYLRLVFDEPRPSTEDRAAVLAVLAENPNLLSPVRELNDVWQQRLESDGIDPVTIAIVRLAIEGLMYEGLFGFDNTPEPLRLQVKDVLLGLTQGQPPCLRVNRGTPEQTQVAIMNEPTQCLTNP
jgi:AcrR family transcriptional regulator